MPYGRLPCFIPTDDDSDYWGDDRTAVLSTARSGTARLRAHRCLRLRAQLGRCRVVAWLINIQCF